MNRRGLPSENLSVFEHRELVEIYDEIRQVYQSTRLPWVIGYSGGKDSTATLQIVWNALSDLPAEELTMPIYVIASDTLVETPMIVDHIDISLRKINEAAQRQRLPISAHKVVPKTTETFWVNLIGRGYPAPTQRFRWCTERMKINPANSFILEKAAEFGEVVMVLGARKTESASRGQVMANHRKVAGSQLRRHHSLARAMVYTPIEDFTTDDVWTYLLEVPSPWGHNNRDLAALYRSAQSDECPLVIDKTTPSCGNSRFGCWTCTVVTKDKSMESMIDNGQEWMIPMLEFRNWLSETQDPEKKHEYRDFKRRNGRITVVDDKVIPGPYRKNIRKQMLKRLLETQQLVREYGPDPGIELITEDELHEIRRIWRVEFPDWEDTVPIIYEEVTGERLDWLQDDIGTFSAQEYRILDEICQANDKYPTELIARLLEEERQMQGMHRRAGIFARIEAVLREDWDDEATVQEKYEWAGTSAMETDE
ncbi:MAG: DNA phosphorothioation system sulfurtransferase DndC [Chloroflexi bacterium]|nr:MAG: DNA phosphorothioation system sulfurtransferase DndC [Chloroflexota bacterium]